MGRAKGSAGSAGDERGGAERAVRKACGEGSVVVVAIIEISYAEADQGQDRKQGKQDQDCSDDEIQDKTHDMRVKLNF